MAACMLYRGRHRIYTAPRPDGGIVTVSLIAARIRREMVTEAAAIAARFRLEALADAHRAQKGATW